MSNNLSLFLTAAIPLWIAQLQKEPWADVQCKLAEKSKTLPGLLGGRGDVLLHGSSKPGEVADLFNQTAEGIALMSFLPGGISLFGGHWESKHEGA